MYRNKETSLPSIPKRSLISLVSPCSHHSSSSHLSLYLIETAVLPSPSPRTPKTNAFPPPPPNSFRSLPIKPQSLSSIMLGQLRSLTFASFHFIHNSKSPPI